MKRPTKNDPEFWIGAVASDLNNVAFGIEKGGLIMANSFLNHAHSICGKIEDVKLKTHIIKRLDKKFTSINEFEKKRLVAKYRNLSKLLVNKYIKFIQN